MSTPKSNINLDLGVDIIETLFLRFSLKIIYKNL